MKRSRSSRKSTEDWTERILITPETSVKHRGESMGKGFAGIFGILVVAGLVLAGVSASAQEMEGQDSGPERYFLASSFDGVDLPALVRQANGRVLVEMPPDRVVAKFVRQSDAALLLNDFRLRSVAPFSGAGESWMVDELDRDMLAGTVLASRKAAGDDFFAPLVNDTRQSGDRLPLFAVPQAPKVPPAGIASMPRIMSAAVPVVPAWPMKNVVAVTIILPESDGTIDTNRENWTKTLEDQVYSEVVAGMAWWPDKAEAYEVDLSFKVYIFKPSTHDEVKTGYEPITHNSQDEGVWIADVLNNLGYSEGYYTSSVDALNSYMKGYAEADHAITIFVVNSQNDSDDMFPDGYFAYAHWGGPLIMMTTGNGGYGLSMMDTVATHEMGHSFYAVDEYDSPGYAECSCNDGYNGCKNRNCMKGCGLNMPCMMRHNENGLCTDTVCHIGWKCQCSSGVCCDGCGYRPGSYICRAKNGDCDLAEFCTGSSTSCPTDKFRDNSYTCRSSRGDCDVAEKCNGSSPQCPTDIFLSSSVKCRDSNGVCDVAEYCSGGSGECPTNAFKGKDVECRESRGDCDGAEFCTGKGADCPSDRLFGQDHVCRESTDLCDAAEVCDGKGNNCPSDKAASASTVCRKAAGGCDQEEYCDGSSMSCPADQFKRSGQVCRAASGGCDREETCDGASAACPPDFIQGKGFVCREAAGGCDVAEKCSGTGVDCPVDLIRGAGFVCRQRASQCDREEKCSGTGAQCPEDLFAESGTSCSDGNPETIDDRCTSDGTCDGDVPLPVAGCSGSAGTGNGAGFGLALILFGLAAAFAMFRRRQFQV